MTKHRTELLPRYLYFFTCTLSLNFPLMYIFPKKAQDKKFVALLIYPHLFGFVFIGYFPLGLSFGAELTFPLQPALVNGTQILFGASSAVFFSSLGAYLTRER